VPEVNDYFVKRLSRAIRKVEPIGALSLGRTPVSPADLQQVRPP